MHLAGGGGGGGGGAGGGGSWGWNPKGYGNKMENESTNHLIYMYDLKLLSKDDGNLKGLL